MLAPAPKVDEDPSATILIGLPVGEEPRRARAAEDRSGPARQQPCRRAIAAPAAAFGRRRHAPIGHLRLRRRQRNKIARRNDAEDGRAAQDEMAMHDVISSLLEVSYDLLIGRA